MIDFDLAIISEEESDEPLINGRLIRGVADLYATMYLAQAAHWNITGVNFQQLHDLFGECYEQAYKAIDDVAEQARQIGAKLPTDIRELLATSAIPAGATEDTEKGYLNALCKAEDMLVMKWNSLAEASGMNAGLNDLVSRLSGEHSKLAWKLRSTLGE